MFINHITVIVSIITTSVLFPAFADTAVVSSPKRPPKLLSGYLTYTLGRNAVKAIDRKYFKPMHAAGFTAVEIKIQSGTSSADRLNLKKTFPELKALVNAASKRNLYFMAYVYPEPYNGKRMTSRKEHLLLPCFVNESGNAVPNRFSLIHWEVWREVFANAFQLAEASRRLAIGAIKIDIETISNLGTSYDDLSWRKFCKEHPELPLNTPASKRNKILIKAKLKKEYQLWFIREFEKTASRFENEMHQINPRLSLGIMPLCHGWISNAFIKKLGTAQAPAILDDWSMYNGNGFTPEVIRRRDQVKKLNRHNLYIPWLRINSYMPSELPPQIYRAVSRCDGYSNWNMYMLTSESKRELYKLPAKTSASEYYDAYRQANTAISTDLLDNSTKKADRIAFRKIISITAPLDLKQLNFPALVPDGTGAGIPQLFSLRCQRTIFIYGKAAQPIKVFIKHLAGSRRPIALQYAIVDKNKNVLRREIINPGGHETFEVTAPYSGIYALVVNGGIGGQAWYGVKVFNRHVAFDARKSIYFFYTRPFSFYVQRSSKKVAELNIKPRKNQVYVWKSGQTKTVVTTGNSSIKLMPQLINKISISAPKKRIKGKYTQDIIVSAKGAVFPFIFDGPERRLIPAQKN